MDLMNSVCKYMYKILTARSEFEMDNFFKLNWK